MTLTKNALKENANIKVCNPIFLKDTISMSTVFYETQIDISLLVYRAHSARPQLAVVHKFGPFWTDAKIEKQMSSEQKLNMQTHALTFAGTIFSTRDYTGRHLLDGNGPQILRVAQPYMCTWCI